MSTLYIREFESMPFFQNGGNGVQIWPEPGLDQTPVTVSGAHAESAAFNTKTKFIVITCDGIYSYVVGSAPVATTSMLRIPADQILAIAVTGGHKISAITNT